MNYSESCAWSLGITRNEVPYGPTRRDAPDDTGQSSFSNIRNTKIWATAMLLSAALLAACETVPDPVPERLSKEQITLAHGDGSAVKCLALSGGGIRSGATSFGFLQGLYAEGQLDDFAAVGSVSGGGYALYGVLDQVVRQRRSLDDVLSLDGEFSAGMGRVPFIRRFDAIAMAPLGVLFGVLNTPLRPIWTLDVYKGSLSFPYGLNIHETFSPSGFEFFIGNSVPLADFRELEGKFPLPVFVTSANDGKIAPFSDHKHTKRDLFELSPKWVGSKRTGYWQPSPELNILHAATASAAALDTPFTDKVRAKGGTRAPLSDFAKFFNFATGVAVRTPDARWHFLADGAFLDPFGAFPLLERGCNDIVIVDMSPDETLKMEEFRYTFAELAHATYKLPKDVLQLGASGWRIAQHVARFHVRDPSGRPLNITLVKLGIDRDNLSVYPDDARKFALSNWSDRNGTPHCDEQGNFLDRRCSFPFELISRLSYGHCEFQAYRSLGVFLAKQYTGSTTPQLAGMSVCPEPTLAPTRAMEASAAERLNDFRAVE